MKRNWVSAAAAALTIAAALWVQTAQAAEIKVLSSIGMRGVLNEVQPQFEKDTGHKLSITYDTSKSLLKLIDAGEKFDATLQTGSIMDQLTQRGIVSGASRFDIARSGLGVAIKAGAERPDISTTESFKQAVLDAKSIGSHASGMAGVAFMDILKNLEIHDAVQPKIKLVYKGYVAKIAATGEAELAVHLISEILPVDGAELLGPFPPDLQRYILLSGAVASDATEPEAAEVFVRYFETPLAVATIKEKGMEPLE